MSRTDKPLVVLSWLERATDGTAAGAHLKGTIARVNASKMSLVGIVADSSSPDGAEPFSRKISRLLSLMLKTGLLARKDRTLIARFHPLMLPVVLWWRLMGARVILSVQGAVETVGENEYPWLRNSKMLKALAVISSHFSNGLIVGAPVIEGYVRKELAKAGTPVISIPNGVFTRDLSAAADKMRPIDLPYAVFVGNLATWQGIGDLVAARHSEKWPEELGLVVIGDGVESPLVDGDEKIRWLGRLPSGEAQLWLAHSVCSFSIQRSDAGVAKHGFWPFKLIESAAAGIPIVCSTAPGLESAGNNLGNAVFAQGGDPDEIAKRVSELFYDVDLRNSLRESGIRNARQFDWTANSIDLEELVHSVWK